MIFRNRVIVADENMPAVEPLFSQFGDVIRVPGRTITPEQINKADVLLVRSITKLDGALIKGAKQLSFIGSATIGMDHIDTDALERLSIPFTNAAGCNAESVVDYTLAAVVSHCHRRGIDPSRLDFGIIGAGNVGGRLANRLTQLGVNVLLSDPPRAETDPTFEDTPLALLLNKSDVVCCHLPMTHQGRYPTNALLTEALLSQLKTGALFVNAGRGPTVDAAGLLRVANNRPDISLVLDVWENEPKVEPLLAARSLIATPHIAGYSLEGKLRGTYLLYLHYCQLVGCRPDISFDSILPEVEIPNVTIGPHTTAYELIKTVYDIKQDDQRLRDSLVEDPTEQAFRFDQLRKQYPVRREFSALPLTGTATANQRTLFQALGFNLSEVN